jgi:hypothetical protein
MRKRVMLFAAPLVIVMIAASVAVAAPGAEHSRGARLDELHAERPTAAFASSTEPSITATVTKAVIDIQDYLAYVTIKDYWDQVGKLDNFLASLPPEASPAAAPQYTAAVYSNTNPGDFLSCVRQRESGGNYGVYNSGGSGAAGAYQFMPGTWNGIAASTGRTDLIGIDPAQASPADQDAMAQALYAQQGAAPWGGGC